MSAAALGCAVELEPSASTETLAESARALQRSADFSVAFAGCAESIGVTLVATTEAAALVPPRFVLVGAGTPVTPLVVRTARCSRISVEGRRGKPGTVVQVGAVIVPPDGTGDINNYTLWYYTDDQRLQSALEKAGLQAQKLPIDYALRPVEGGPAAFSVRLARPASPPLALQGSVTPVTAPAGAFLANWWSDSPRCGTLKLSTEVPVIAIGGASLVLTTKPGSALAELLGATSSDFPLLQQFNAFASAEMHVSAAD